MPSNLTIANIFLFSRSSAWLSAPLVQSPFYFFYSFGATTLAGAVRHSQLPHETLTARASPGRWNVPHRR